MPHECQVCTNCMSDFVPHSSQVIKLDTAEMKMPLDRTQDSMLGDLLKITLAVILPPLGVFLEVGLGKHFWINVILTLLGFIPGIIHAVYIIASR